MEEAFEGIVNLDAVLKTKVKWAVVPDLASTRTISLKKADYFIEIARAHAYIHNKEGGQRVLAQAINEHSFHDWGRVSFNRVIEMAMLATSLQDAQQSGHLFDVAYQMIADHENIILDAQHSLVDSSEHRLLHSLLRIALAAAYCGDRARSQRLFAAALKAAPDIRLPNLTATQNLLAQIKTDNFLLIADSYLSLGQLDEAETALTLAEKAAQSMDTGLVRTHREASITFLRSTFEDVEGVRLAIQSIDCSDMKKAACILDLMESLNPHGAYFSNKLLEEVQLKLGKI